jgi:mono/diheme cytochrome c family protein
MKRVLLIAAVSIPAAAFTFGGWAVTTVEDVPEFAVAGKPFEVAYTVRQHGMTLLSKLTGIVTISAGDSARRFLVSEVGEGMYKSQVTIPSAGVWTVQIRNGFGDRSGTSFTVEARSATAAATAPMRPFERGKQLFVAKGCATCHSHQLTKDFLAANLGPDLSEPKFADAYLARFLANPGIKTDWKSEWRMPNLGLDRAEISAIVAFLNQERK